MPRETFLPSLPSSRFHLRAGRKHHREPISSQILAQRVSSGFLSHLTSRALVVPRSKRREDRPERLPKVSPNATCGRSVTSILIAHLLRSFSLHLVPISSTVFTLPLPLTVFDNYPARLSHNVQALFPLEGSCGQGGQAGKKDLPRAYEDEDAAESG